MGNVVNVEIYNAEPSNTWIKTRQTPFAYKRDDDVYVIPITDLRP